MSPARALHLAGVAEHAAHRVDRDPLVARPAAEVLVVLLLQPGPADHGRAVHGGVVLGLGLVELGLGDRAEVAEHVGGVDAVRRRVGPHVLGLHQHRREVLLLLHDRDGDLLADVLGDRHGLVGRAVPAGARDRAGLAAQQRARLDLLGRDVHGLGEPGQQGGLLVVAHLVQHGPVEADHPGGAVGDQRAAHVVDDQAARGLHHELADGLLGGLRLVGLPAEHLHVPEPGEQGHEQRQHQRLDHDQAQPSLGRRWSVRRRGLRAIRTRPGGAAAGGTAASPAAARRG